MPPVTAVAAGTDAEVAAVAAATGVPHAGAGMAVAVAAVEVAAMAVVVAAAAVAAACGSRAWGFARRVDAPRERAVRPPDAIGGAGECAGGATSGILF